MSLAERASAAAEVCCDDELAALLRELADASSAPAAQGPPGPCRVCGADVRAVGDGMARLGHCQRCYDRRRYATRGARR